MSRETLLDCETTGLSRTDDYVVEIGCVEMVDGRVTGRELHLYCKPPKRMPREAQRVHGITDKFLKDKPAFHQIVDDFLAFIGDDPIVAHNASFDAGMLNSELKRLDRPALSNEIIDTIVLSKQARPGKKHNLDAICRDYGIDLRRRTKHGALLDAQILAEAYVELKGGRQGAMFADHVGEAVKSLASLETISTIALPRPRRCLSAEEWLDHLMFRSQIKDPIWADYDALCA